MRSRFFETVGIALLVVTGGCGSSGPTAGPPQPLRTFAADATTITQDGVTAEEGGWRIARSGAGSVPLFEVADPGVENAVLLYRAQLRSEGVTGKAYLEMWVRVPGRGEFFSRGLTHAVTGTTGWSSHEIPFFVNEPGVRPDLVKLNVAFEGGGGTVWIKDAVVLQAPLGG